MLDFLNKIKDNKSNVVIIDLKFFILYLLRE